MLVPGINVFSTVNVQHLESLNDQVGGAHGRACKGDIPGPGCSRAADEVVLVDLTPEALTQRLREGRSIRRSACPRR